jgi:tRNA-specific 2-thiouridylase
MKVAVGMSGGVDSSVAAALLKEKGYDVIGICMKIWDGTPLIAGEYHACYGPDEVGDIEDATRIAEQLGIPFHVIDLVEEYKTTILDYFKGEYLVGRTPNPCIKCNQHIKFKKLISKTQDLGIRFNCFATGHYARVEYSSDRKRYLLRKAKDIKKDQSYWLAFLSQEQLSTVIFPLGDLTKGDVREKARALRLDTHDKPDSQDFFSGDYKQLIDVPDRPGPIRHKDGTVLGTHSGIWSYTIGQRKGLGISAKKPLYVVDIDERENTVIVGFREDLAHGGLTAHDVHLIAVENITQPMQVTMKIRYAQRAFEGRLHPLQAGTAHVTFREPQLAVTPGQAVVFYDGDYVVGGGIIERGEE